MLAKPLVVSVARSDSLTSGGLLVVEPVLAAMILDLVEGSRESVKKTGPFVSRRTHRNVETQTYVLMMARIKVPQGKLQVSSLALFSPMIVLGSVPSASRLGL